MMDGKGIFYWPDGRQYDGLYIEAEKHGYGVMSWPDGREYSG